MLDRKSEEHDAAGADAHRRDCRPSRDHALALQPAADRADPASRSVRATRTPVAPFADLVGRAGRKERRRVRAHAVGLRLERIEVERDNRSRTEERVGAGFARDVADRQLELRDRQRARLIEADERSARFDEGLQRSDSRFAQPTDVFGRQRRPRDCRREAAARMPREG